jgi:hypothetical protein
MSDEESGYQFDEDDPGPAEDMPIDYGEGDYDIDPDMGDH